MASRIDKPEKQLTGYREIEHTADWELEVWAPDLPALLEQAARGMYVLSGTHLQENPQVERVLELQIVDPEGLLVTFLSELLYLSEHDNLGFNQYQLSLNNDTLYAQLQGAPIASQGTEIKAVTYHNLAIRQVEHGLKVHIVFDV